MQAKKLSISIPLPTMPSLNTVKRMLTSKPKLNKIRTLIVLRHATKGYDWTPDWRELEEDEFTPFFAYCNVQKGGTRYSIIEDIIKTKSDDGKSVCPYAFTRDAFEMWQTKDGVLTQPVALTSRASPLTTNVIPLSNFTPATGRVKGRLYYVRSIDMKTLDAEKQNGVLFTRQKVKIVVPYRMQIRDPIPGHRSYTTGHCLTDEEAETYKAWMYIGNSEYWDNYPSSDLRRVDVCSYDRQWQHLDRTYFAPPKRWIEGPFYYFNPWKEANNNTK